MSKRVVENYTKKLQQALNRNDVIISYDGYHSNYSYEYKSYYILESNRNDLQVNDLSVTMRQNYYPSDGWAKQILSYYYGAFDQKQPLEIIADNRTIAMVIIGKKMHIGTVDQINAILVADKLVGEVA